MEGYFKPIEKTSLVGLNTEKDLEMRVLMVTERAHHLKVNSSLDNCILDQSKNKKGTIQDHLSAKEL